MGLNALLSHGRFMMKPAMEGTDMMAVNWFVNAIEGWSVAFVVAGAVLMRLFYGIQYKNTD